MAYSCKNLSRLLGEAQHRGISLRFVANCMTSKVWISPNDLSSIRNSPKKTVHSAIGDKDLSLAEYLLAHWEFSQEKLIHLLRKLHDTLDTKTFKSLIKCSLYRETFPSSPFMQLIRGERNSLIQGLTNYHLERLVQGCEPYGVDTSFLLPPEGWRELPRKHAQEMADIMAAQGYFPTGQTVMLATLGRPPKNGKFPAGVYTFKHPFHGYTAVVVQEGADLGDWKQYLVIWEDAYTTTGLLAA